MVTLAHTLALFVVVSIAVNISSRHVNLIVTFGMELGGNFIMVQGVLYWIAQLFGSSMVYLLLKLMKGGLTTLSHCVAVGMISREGIVKTFKMVYTVYATIADLKNGDVGIVPPITIKFTIFAGGPFSSGSTSMNPARSFGSALVSGDWTYQWVYWVGPLLRGNLTEVIYGGIFISTPNHIPYATQY